jgi:hypothetical protein
MVWRMNQRFLPEEVFMWRGTHLGMFQGALEGIPERNGTAYEHLKNTSILHEPSPCFFLLPSFSSSYFTQKDK